MSSFDGRQHLPSSLTECSMCSSNYDDPARECGDTVTGHENPTGCIGSNAEESEGKISERAKRLEKTTESEAMKLQELAARKSNVSRRMQLVNGDAETSIDNLVKSAEELTVDETTSNVTRQTRTSRFGSVEELRKLDNFFREVNKQSSAEISSEAIRTPTEQVIGCADGQVRVVQATVSSTPAMTHVIDADNDREVVGVTSVDRRLFVLRNPSEHRIQVYDTDTLNLQQAVEVNGLSDDTSWSGLTSCSVNNYLFISDHDEATVYKVQLKNGNTILKWSVSHRPMGLSINTARNLIVACFDDKKIQEYTTSGSLVREIHLHWDDDTFLNPWHVIQLTSGHFLVSCDHADDVSDVVEADADGRFLLSYSDQLESTDEPKFSCPRQLAIDDKHERIYVVDCWRDSLVTLNRSLNLISRESYETSDVGGFRTPSCIHFNASQGRIFIGERRNRLSHHSHVDRCSHRVLAKDVIG